MSNHVVGNISNYSSRQFAMKGISCALCCGMLWCCHNTILVHAKRHHNKNQQQHVPRKPLAPRDHLQDFRTATTAVPTIREKRTIAPAPAPSETWTQAPTSSSLECNAIDTASIGEFLVACSEPDGTVVSYQCQEILANNELVTLLIAYRYRLWSPQCTADAANHSDMTVVLVNAIEEQLLARAQNAFLPTVTSCVQPQNPWFAALGRDPVDQWTTTPANDTTACVAPTMPDNSCCVVVDGTMSFTQAASVDPDQVEAWIYAQLQDSTILDGIEVPVGVEILD